MNENHKNYTDHSAAALRHSVIEGELNLEQFNILKQSQVESKEPKFTIHGRIIGASHLFTFDFDSRVFHELFACQENEIPNNEIAWYGPLGKVSATIQLKLWNRIDYSFQAKLLRYVDAGQWLNEFEQNAAEIGRSEQWHSMGLVFDFPMNESIKIVPKTIVTAHYYEPDGQIKITTAHSYPNEQTIVRSESTLQLV